MKRLLNCILFALTLTSLAACQQQSSKDDSLRVGTIAGPETTIVEVAQEFAKDNYDLDIEIVTFEDYNTPNIALNDGTIDVNIFQSGPFLDEAIAARGYDLVAIGRTFIYPVVLYSHTYTDITDLPINATIAIPNDPSQGARALLLLQEAGLINLDPSKGIIVDIRDITDNPKEINIIELDAAQLPRALEDVDGAVINNTYSIAAGLEPRRDGLFIEGPDSPYANLIVVRQDRVGDPRFDQLIEAMHAQPVVDKAFELFQEVVPAW